MKWSKSDDPRIDIEAKIMDLVYEILMLKEGLLGILKLWWSNIIKESKKYDDFRNMIYQNGS